MHVPDDRARGRAFPSRSFRRCEQAVEVDGIQSHLELPVHNRPFRFRPVSVYLDAEAVGVAQIEGFTHEVICLSGVSVDVREMRNEPAKIGARWKQYREVVEA